MFVGYEIKTNQAQSKPLTLTNDIKLSQAVLDPASKQGNKKEPVCLMAEHNKKQFILAVLDPNKSWQCPLDLMFAAGSSVKFFLRGSGSVHVTGFEYPEEFDDMSMSMSSEDDELDSDIEAEQPLAKKLKASATKKSPKTNGVPAKSSVKKTPRRLQLVKGGDEDEDSDDDFDEEADSDDDEDFSKLTGGTDDSDDDGEDFDEDDDDEEEDEEMDEDVLGELDEEGSEDEESDE